MNPDVAASSTSLGMYEQMEYRSSDYINNSEFFSCLEISERVSHQKLHVMQETVLFLMIVGTCIGKVTICWRFVD